MVNVGFLAQAANAAEPLLWGWQDSLTLGLFFVGMLMVIWWVVSQKEETSADYFLAGRSAGWIAIGASIFASNIGSEHLVGLAGAGAESGLAMSHWELQSWLILVLGWVFVPFYSRSKVFTMPEFLERRYNSASRTFLSLISLIGYVLTKVAVTVYAGAIVIQTVLGIESVSMPLFGDVNFFWIAALSLVAITGVYTVLGGMKAVLYTSVLQTPVLLLGSIVILFVGLSALGDGEGLIAGYRQLEETAGDQMSLIRPPDDAHFPWTGVLLGSAIIGFWYWCTDQYIVQRVLSAPDQKQARRGSIFGAYLKMTPVFFFMFPGMIAFALHQRGDISLLDEAGVFSGDRAFPTLVSQLLPLGIKGVVVGGLVAALMSSLASLFNSSAALFTVDFYQRYKPDASEKHYVFVGRVATVVVVGLGILWVPVMRALGSVLYEYLQDVQSLIAPGIASVFIMGVFSKKTTPAAGLWGMVLGFVLGMFRLLMNVLVQIFIIPDDVTAVRQWLIEHAQTGEGLTTIQHWMVSFMAVNWLHYSIFLLAFCLVAIWIISRFTAAPRPEQIQGLTYGSVNPQQNEETRNSWNKWDVIHSCIIVGIIIAFYIYYW